MVLGVRLPDLISFLSNRKLNKIRLTVKRELNRFLREIPFRGRHKKVRQTRKTLEPVKIGNLNWYKVPKYLIRYKLYQSLFVVNPVVNDLIAVFFASFLWVIGVEAVIPKKDLLQKLCKIHQNRDFLPQMR